MPSRNITLFGGYCKLLALGFVDILDACLLKIIYSSSVLMRIIWIVTPAATKTSAMETQRFVTKKAIEIPIVAHIVANAVILEVLEIALCFW